MAASSAALRRLFSSSSAEIRQLLLEAQERTLAKHGVDRRFSAAWYFYRSFLRGKTPHDVQGFINLLRRIFISNPSRSNAARFLKLPGDHGSPWRYLIYLMGACAILMAVGQTLMVIGGEGDEDGEHGGGEDGDLYLYLPAPVPSLVRRHSSGLYYVHITHPRIAFRLSDLLQQPPPPPPPGHLGHVLHAAGKLSMVRLSSTGLLVALDPAEYCTQGAETRICVRGFTNAKGQHYGGERRVQKPVDMQDQDATHPNIVGGGMKPAADSNIGYGRVVASSCRSGTSATGRPNMVGLQASFLRVLVALSSTGLLVALDPAEFCTQGAETRICVRGFTNAKGQHYGGERRVQKPVDMQDQDATHPNIVGGGMKPAADSNIGYGRVVASSCRSGTSATGKPNMVGLQASFLRVLVDCGDDPAQASTTRICGRAAFSNVSPTASPRWACTTTASVLAVA